MQVTGKFIDVTKGAKAYSFEHPVSITYTQDLEKLSEPSDVKVDKQVEVTKSAQTLEQKCNYLMEEISKKARIYYIATSHTWKTWQKSWAMKVYCRNLL
ncbi:hypothetical protein SAMN05421743_102203 [Thalassobacillus cyri]|uniref:Uncharacterized protein n=1 Tax=Thalassobacillus cyri TaxID=571932 RepID=A0A1H3XMQ8_9BACI|nr:hypothetical protein [Thalassobacillus cyri]SEA00745.1 hypothetical protein SAMN05421743_102203 [Thalassobacillus cyri]